MARMRLVALPLGLAALCVAPFVARAQFLDSYFQNGLAIDPALRGPEVATRPRPDYAPLGIHLGGVTIRPEARESLGYDSNVAGTHDGPGSPAVRTQAAVDAESDTSVSSMIAGLGVDQVTYATLPDQSHTDWTASLAGTRNFGEDVLSLSYRHGSLHEKPNGIGSLGIIAPVPYQLDYAVASYAASRGRFTLTPQISVASYLFGTVTTHGVTQGGDIDDRVLPVGSMTLAYELSPSRDVLVVARGGATQYLNNRAGAPSRDSTSVEILAGLQYAADAVIRYRALVGVEEQKYQSSAYRAQQAPVAEASAIWTPTGLTTVTGTLSRSIADSLSGNTIGYTYTTGQISVDHEYLPNVLLHANTLVELQQDATSNVKAQTLYGGGVGVSWLMNRNARLTGSYSYARGNQSSGYSRNMVSLSLGLAL